MSNKQIICKVHGEYVSTSDRIIGTVGSYRSTELLFQFDSVWDNTSKRVYFTDAIGSNSILMLLTQDNLVDDSYVVSVPAEPLVTAGLCTVSLQGIETNDESTERIIVSTQTQMQVLPSKIPIATNETISQP